MNSYIECISEKIVLSSCKTTESDFHSVRPIVIWEFNFILKRLKHEKCVTGMEKGLQRASPCGI